MYAAQEVYDCCDFSQIPRLKEVRIDDTEEGPVLGVWPKGVEKEDPNAANKA